MPRLGTNPFAAGFPRTDGPPIVVDFATSRWAVGKVRVAMHRGESVPPGTLLDNNGRPTVDPSALFGVPPGGLLTLGEHKGWGLSLACELLAGRIDGSQTQSGPRSSAAIINSLFSVLVAPKTLRTASQFSESLEHLVQWVLSENQTGAEHILLPGEPELATKERRLSNGIPIDPVTLGLIAAAAKDVGLHSLDLS